MVEISHPGSPLFMCCGKARTWVSTVVTFSRQSETEPTFQASPTSRFLYPGELEMDPMGSGEERRAPQKAGGHRKLGVLKDSLAEWMFCLGEKCPVVILRKNFQGWSFPAFAKKLKPARVKLVGLARNNPSLLSGPSAELNNAKVLGPVTFSPVLCFIPVTHHHWFFFFNE